MSDLNANPIWYQTGWFYFVLVILLLVMIYGIYATRSWRHKLHRKALQEQVAEKTAELKIISEIGKALNTSLDAESIISTLYQHINQWVDAHAFSIGILQPELGHIDFQVAMADDQRLPPHVEWLSDPTNLSVWCVKHDQEVLIQQRDDILKFIPKLGDPTVGKKMESFICLPLKDADQQIIGCIVIQSPRKNAYTSAQMDIIRTLGSYTAIALNNAHTYGQLEQKNTEIIATQQQLIQAEKMASLGQLTAGVAHEINNPTNFVHVSAQNLQVKLEQFKQFINDLVAEDADEAIAANFNRRFDALFLQLNTILEGSQRIQAIVRDLRAFTRLDEAQYKAAYIGDCITSTLNLIKSQYAQSVVFKTEFNANPQLNCRPSQLNQVFMNLLVNACDAIRCDTNKDKMGEITVIVDQDADYIHISIADNGCGMSKETKNKLFEPFYTTKEIGKGTGLGLSISFGIISDHQGSIEVHSTEGVGSQFIIHLPTAWRLTDCSDKVSLRASGSPV